MHELGQVLCHSFRQRGDQCAEAGLCRFPAFVDAILHLVFDRFDLNRRIDQSRWTNDLFGKDAARLLHLPPAGRCRNAHRLWAHDIPFVKAQWPVVDARGQAETIFGQGQLTPVVALGHCADLRYRLMAFVNEQKRIVWQIFKQGRWRFPGQAPREKARVIFDASTRTRCGNHLEIEIGPLLQPLRLQQFAFGDQFLQSLGQLKTDSLAGLLHCWPRGYIMAISVDAHAVQLCAGKAGERVELGNFLNLVAKEADTPCGVLIM